MKTGSERDSKKKKKNQRGYREKMRKPQVSNQIKTWKREERERDGYKGKSAKRGVERGRRIVREGKERVCRNLWREKGGIA